MANQGNTNPKVHIEYCGPLDEGDCFFLVNAIKKYIPNAEIICKSGRQGSFEIMINDILVYSKLQTMAYPDYRDVVAVVKDVSKGKEPRQIRQHHIDCVMS